MLFFRRKFGPQPLVKFVVAGTQKGGTTALDKYLRGHKGILMAARKEAHFFDTEKHFKNSTPDYSIYHSLFRGVPRGRLVGESTPIYMYWKDAVPRIKEYNPRMKLIMTLRNPIDRAFSGWNMERERGRDELSFWDAIQGEEDRCAAGDLKQNKIFSYTDRGLYAQQLKWIWKFFPKNQTHVIKSEDLRNEANSTLQGISKFLRIEPFENDIKEKTVHARSYTTQMSEQERDFLRTKFRTDIRELESLLGWDCSEWLK